MEVLGAHRFRTKVKRRKAAWVGKSTHGDEALYPFETHGVVATGLMRILYILPEAFCRVPSHESDGRP